MSDKQTLSIMIPVLLVALLFCYITLRLFFSSQINLVLRGIFRYLLISIIICLSFSMVYFIVALYEFTITSQNNGKFVTNVSSIPGLHLNVEQRALALFLEVLFFSFSTYFHLPVSMNMEGMTRIVIVLQGSLGIIIPFIISLITFNRTSTDKLSKNILHTYLNRGWDILRTRKNNSGETASIELISPTTEIKYLFIDNIKEYKDELDNFMIDWSSVDINFLPFFLNVLEEPLRETNTILSIDARMMFSKRDVLSQTFWLEFKMFLEKIYTELPLLTAREHTNNLEIVLTRINQIIQMNFEHNNNEDAIDE